MGRDKTKQRKTKKAAQGGNNLGDAAIPDSKDDTQSLKAKGNKAFAQNDFQEAVDLYTQALAESKDTDHTLFSNRSAAYLALSKFESALEDGKKCIELKPDWPKGYLRQGDALTKLLRYPEAFAAYKKGLELDPEDVYLKQSYAKLSDLLQELKLTEQQLTQSANPEQDKFALMVDWMAKGGAKHPMLYMQYYSEDYRGVHALCKINVGEMVLLVPCSHIMTSEVAKGSEIGKKIISTGVDLRSKHSFLAAYLLEEKHKGKDSYWYPYMNILPQKYRNMPIFFTDEEKNYLKGSFVYDKIQDRLDSLQAEYDGICRGVPEFKRFTCWEFIWARLVVITRIFGLVIKGKKTDGLVPYADMLNHKRPKDGVETKWTFDDDLYGFTIITTKSIQRGAEVYDSYGRKCNSRFFVNYGFTLDENDDNEVVIRVGLPKTDPHYQTKIRYLGGYERSAQREFQIPANYREKKTKALFSFARFIHCKGDEILTLPPDNSKIDDIDPISIENEIAVLQHLARAARAVLDGFDTTIEEDEKMLALPRSEIDSNLRNCVCMRHGEKQVLHWFLKLAEECVPMLQMPWKDLKKRAARSYNTADIDPVDGYITSCVVPLVKGQK